MSSSSSVGRSFATFSFDSKYVREREMASAHHAMPRHIGHGLLSGSLAFARGVGEGLTGLITAPIEGAKEQGVKGMFKGFGRGAAGLAATPTRPDEDGQGALVDVGNRILYRCAEQWQHPVW